MTHITCRLTAKNRDQLRNLTLDNQVWATFTLPNMILRIYGAIIVTTIAAMVYAAVAITFEKKFVGQCSFVTTLCIVILLHYC